MKALLFAIHPEHARAILDRRKLREVRKTKAKNICEKCEHAENGYIKEFGRGAKR